MEDHNCFVLNLLNLLNLCLLQMYDLLRPVSGPEFCVCGKLVIRSSEKYSHSHSIFALALALSLILRYLLYSTLLYSTLLVHNPVAISLLLLCVD